MSPEEILRQLCQFDTPSVTNVVATYPDHPLCLGLYHPWSGNWYTDQSVRCMFPQLGPMAGHVVTCVYGLPDPGDGRLGFMDVIDALEATPRPTILVLQQQFPPELSGKVGLAGGNMTTAMQAVGCIGCVSNGPSRDLDEIRPLRFQYLLTGVTPGHGPMAVRGVQVPVTVAGMDVSPGDIVHMDENGACKFPARCLQAVLDHVRRLRAEEATRLEALRQAGSAAQVRAAFGGQAGGRREPARQGA